MVSVILTQNSAFKTKNAKYSSSVASKIKHKVEEVNEFLTKTQAYPKQTESYSIIEASNVISTCKTLDYGFNGFKITERMIYSIQAYVRASLITSDTLSKYRISEESSNVAKSRAPLSMVAA